MFQIQFLLAAVLKQLIISELIVFNFAAFFFLIGGRSTFRFEMTVENMTMPIENWLEGDMRVF